MVDIAKKKFIVTQKENESIGIRHTNKPSKDKYVNPKTGTIKYFV
nr:MAG TPA: hypothetical protein [Caudoviricetes sp.]